ncbi:hypothetical protein Dda_4343 [Drechslerella dactyloides]|uniref:F-box domain-containing protein n=1 Tax=Drechslerella dactyloides TaxID=74499 RepID=A0AAD6NJ65_DREDA|nr:hypothetical protein Dda_4343 [Drechslerella dactyloides]
MAEAPSTDHVSSMSIPTATPQTDISCLPLELHSEILNCLDHWIHLLSASQVCQSWRHLLKARVHLPSFYQPVHAILPLEKAPGGYHPFQPVIFGTPIPSLSTTYDHSRHALLQDCAIAYRRCPKTGDPQLKVHPGKNIGFFDRDTLAYYPDSTVTEPMKFYDCSYLSLLASPIVIDPRPLAQKTLIWLQIARLCSTTIYAMMRADGEYLQLGKVLDLILERYTQCLELECMSCAAKFPRNADGTLKDAYGDFAGGLDIVERKWSPGWWEKAAYDNFARQCRQFGIIIKEDESMRLVGRIVLTVSPGETW